MINMVFSNHIYNQIQSENKIEKSKKKRGGVSVEKPKEIMIGNRFYTLK
jgi:hypothetical protein